LLHSGARYAVHDPIAAQRCIEENRILRKIAPEALEHNGGLFVAVADADLDYSKSFLAVCRECGNDVKKINPDQARGLEPELNPDLKGANQVPDASRVCPTAVYPAWQISDLRRMLKKYKE
jgi:glycerol-3-phosphate dehydrogenase